MFVLEVNSLCKRFGSLQAVQEISFRVERGQIFGLLGPNGSGKTTTIACALGLLDADSGSARVLGFESKQLARTGGKLGTLFDQDALINGLSVRGNLEYAQRLLGHRGGRSWREALELTDIGGLAERRASKLSLGQKKRVALARALLGSPELLILDEPLSALDPMGVKATLQLIRELAAEGVSVLLSSHRLHEMQELITHAIVLDAGRTRAQGPLHELLGTSGAGYRLCLLDAQDPLQTLRWMINRFVGLQAEILSVQRIGETEFELRGIDDREFGAQLCAGLCEQNCKIKSLVPTVHSLQTYFEDVLRTGKAQA